MNRPMYDRSLDIIEGAIRRAQLSLSERMKAIRRAEAAFARPTPVRWSSDRCWTNCWLTGFLWSNVMRTAGKAVLCASARFGIRSASLRAPRVERSRLDLDDERAQAARIRYTVPVAADADDGDGCRGPLPGLEEPFAHRGNRSR